MKRQICASVPLSLGRRSNLLFAHPTLWSAPSAGSLIISPESERTPLWSLKCSRAQGLDVTSLFKKLEEARPEADRLEERGDPDTLKAFPASPNVPCQSLLSFPSL